jgi:L-ascorbate metabolism protein UlaG (beta-lactamase superfamily)
MDGSPELTYTGVAGWRVRTQARSLLFDPYFTRMSILRGEFGPAIPNRAAIEAHAPPADAIFISHPHFDHLMDAPHIAHLTGAPIYTSPQGCQLLHILGVPDGQICSIGSGDRLSLGDATLTVFRVQHRIIFGRVPFQGPLRPGLKPPLHGRDYRMEQIFSFLVEMDGIRLLVCNGIDAEPAVRADIVLVGPDAARWQLALILGDAQPRVVMPNHWDNMFQPLSAPIKPMIQSPRGFTLFPRRIDLRAFTRHVHELAPGARVIVPDRFHPYSLADLLA